MEKIKISEIQTLNIQSTKILVVEIKDTSSKSRKAKPIGKMICTPLSRRSSALSRFEVLSLPFSNEIN